MMNKTIPLLFMLAGAGAARAQQPAPAGRAPIVLRAGRMQAQAHGAANRPDKAPAFPGGAAALGVFFQQHAAYPDAARARHLSGNVLLTATVGVDGRVSDAKVVQSLSPECDAEALRVVSLLTGWQPAMRRSRPLAVLIQLPVPFGAAGVMTVDQSGHLPRHGKK